jgi:hypothetical protein
MPEPPTGIGPGARSGGEPAYSAAQQLIDQLEASPIKGKAKAASPAKKASDAIAAGRATTGTWRGQIAALGQFIKQTFRGVREPTDLDNRLGVLDRKLQVSAGENILLKKALKKQIPNQTLREATAIWVDAGGDEAAIRDTLANLPAKTRPNIRRALEMAANLPEEAKAFARLQQDFFGRRLQDAQAAGVLDEGLENYYTHIWKKVENMPDSLRAALGNGRVNTYFQYARQRKISTLLEGIKAGMTPELDPADILPHYSWLMDRAIASREFIKDLSEAKASDGRAAVVPSGFSPSPDKTGGTRLIKPLVTSPKWETDPVTGERKVVAEFRDYERINHPALRRWKWLGKDAEGQGILMEGELQVHPQYYERLRRIMDRGVLTPSPAMQTALRISTEAKGLKLGLPSAFHLTHVASHALWHWVNPFANMEPIQWDSSEVQYALEKGHLKLAPSPAELHEFGEGYSGGRLVEKIPLLGHMAKASSEWLFGEYIPKLKMNTFRAAMERNLEYYAKDIQAGKVSRDAIAARVGDAVNNAYGELNQMFLGKQGRNPNMQRFLRLTFLAPDFGEARLRFVGKAFTQFGHEERLALATAFVTLYTISRAANYLSTGDPQWEWRNAFRVKVGNKWWGVRSVVGDLDRAITDNRSFIMSRVNPLTTRTGVEWMTGRDWRGVKRDFGDQLKDMAAVAVPIQLGGLTRDDQTVRQGFIGAMGAQSQTESPEQYIGRKAQEWTQKHPTPLGRPMEAVYDPEKDVTRKLKMALANNEPQAAREELEKLLQKVPLKNIQASVLAHLHHPFAGSKIRDAQFVRSLSDKERQTYQEAVQNRTRQLELARSIGAAPPER